MSIRVLIVDDEKDFVEALAERLQIRNFTVTCASRGIEALELISRNVYDVILLDILMPGMDGIETYAEIRRLDKQVKVIMLTGHAKVETAINGVKAGVYCYLLKPVKIDDLVEKVELAYRQKFLSQQQP